MKPFGICILALAGLLQGTGSIPATATNPDGGQVNKGIYQNTFFGLSYRLPEQLKVNTDEHKSASRAADSDNHHASSFILLNASEDTKEAKVKEGVMVIADKADFYGGLRNGNDYLERLTSYYARQGSDVIHSSVECSYAGKQFFRGDYARPGTTKIVYMSALVTVRRGYALSFIFTAGSRERLEELVGTLQSIAFSGSDSAP